MLRLSVLLTLPFLFCAFLAGGYSESIQSLLAAAVCFSLAAALVLAPAARPTPAVAVLAGFGIWSALSCLWGPPGAALRTVPLVALYTGVLLAAEAYGSESLLRALRGGVVAVVGAGLVTRVGDWFPPSGGPHPSALYWPVSYSNGLGLVAITAVLLCAGLPSARPRLASAAAALSGAAAYLTLSRNALLVGAAASVLLLALRSESARGLTASLTGLAAVVLLDVSGRTAGIRLVPVLAVAAVAAALLPPLRLALPRRAALLAVLPLAVLATVFAQPLAARFSAPSPRESVWLLDLSGHGRALQWRVAWREGLEHPVLGRGAGTWPRAYIARTGSLNGPAAAHSLYLQSFSELGVVGAGLIVAFIGLVIGAGWRARAQPWAAVALAVFAAWALHSVSDWDWQLPATTIPALLCAGMLVARRRAPLRTGASLLSAAALAIGVFAGFHGFGAALLENGITSPSRASLATALLPDDSRPYVSLALHERFRNRKNAQSAHARACRIDPGEPTLLVAYPPSGACPDGV